jgi:hypothetical protein
MAGQGGRARPKQRSILENQTMTFFRNLRVFTILSAFVAVFALSACGEEGTAEKAGKKMDKAAGDLKKKLGN